MKKYHLIVCQPGNYSIRVTINADEFTVENGGYYFYQNIKNNDSIFNDRKLLCVYPVVFTIINSIE